jgi:GT2 family glycosyltransferase
MTATLQTLPTPQIGLCTELEMYVCTHRGAWWSFDESAAVLGAGDWITTDTYFGVFSCGKWRRHTTIERVEIVVGVTGDVEAEVVHRREGHGDRVVAVGRSRSGAAEVVLPLDLADLDEGHVFVWVRAHEDGCRFRSLTVRTADEPAREVRLGISVTTYNRQSYVTANAARLDRYVAARDDLGEIVRLQVIDNAANAALDPTTHLTSRVVPNRNLGGAGGFARGLIGLRNEGWATHVLFMDDDVTFEPEIVGRIVAVLAHARDPMLCISGSMLREEFHNRQFEAGARIDHDAVHIWQVNGFDYDLTEEDELLDNEAELPIDYGGWWCFAFPVDLTPDNPLPIFVRGDDVCFGLRYAAGRTMAMNGIGVWHQEFANKNNPVTFFYESRNIPVVLSVSRDAYGARALRKRVADRTLRFSSAFKYESASAVLDGTEAFLDGPDRLIAIPADMLHDELRARYGERIEPLPLDRRSTPAWQPPRQPLPYALRALSLATLGGHLVPHRLRRSGRWAVRVDTTPAMAPFGADELVFRHDASGDGFVARRDTERFKALLRRLRAVDRRIKEEFDSAAEAWRAAYPKLVSEQYWRDQFNGTTGA